MALRRRRADRRAIARSSFTRFEPFGEMSKNVERVEFLQYDLISTSKIGTPKDAHYMYMYGIAGDASI